jgi:hypothetical protein
LLHFIDRDSACLDGMEIRPKRETGWTVAGYGGEGSAEHLFVHVAPEPALVGLGGADDGMLGGLVVLGGVAVFGRVATADVAAFEAGAEMHPFIAQGDTLCADVDLRRGVFAVFEVGAERHVSLLWGGCIQMVSHGVSSIPQRPKQIQGPSLRSG